MTVQLILLNVKLTENVFQMNNLTYVQRLIELAALMSNSNLNVKMVIVEIHKKTVHLNQFVHQDLLYVQI